MAVEYFRNKTGKIVKRSNGVESMPIPRRAAQPVSYRQSSDPSRSVLEAMYNKAVNKEPTRDRNRESLEQQFAKALDKHPSRRREVLAVARSKIKPKGRALLEKQWQTLMENSKTISHRGLS